jgi:hypothetical protein
MTRDLDHCLFRTFGTSDFFPALRHQPSNAARTRAGTYANCYRHREAIPTSLPDYAAVEMVTSAAHEPGANEASGRLILALSPSTRG